jgi:replicative DNA helicase
MAGDRLTTSLSESILTVLCFSNDPKADLIASLVTPELFEVYFREICSRVIEYRQTFKQAPGASHIDDIFDFVLNDPKHRLYDIYRRILQGLYEQSSSGFNTEYIASRVSSFVRQQTLKSAVLEAAQAIQRGSEDYSEEVETILLNTIQRKVDLEDPGVFLGDKEKALRFLDSDGNECCQLGIKELDKRHLGPTRKELSIFLAPRKRGKSMYLIHVGKMALLQRWKVAHITLEMSEDVVVQRYIQSLFSMSKRPEQSVRTFFELDELKRLSGFDVRKAAAKLNLEDPNIRKQLRAKMDEWGFRLNNIIVKQFPSGDLTIRSLESYLDSIEIVHKFVPDVIIIDYIALMKLNVDNYTHSLGQTAVALRGLAVKRNLAVVTAAQGNRESESAAKVESHMVAGDISLIATCDLAMTYSQTPQERQLGLARLFVANARNEEDQFTVLLSQNYSTSQFCLDSIYMSSNYNHLVESHSQPPTDG